MFVYKYIEVFMHMDANKSGIYVCMYKDSIVIYNLFSPPKQEFRIKRFNINAPMISKVVSLLFIKR